MVASISRIVSLLFLGACALGAAAQSLEIEGVKLEPTVQLGGSTLQLNGAGVRTRAIFRVYVAGLYVPQKATTPAALLAQKGPRRVAITTLRNLDADSFAGGLNDGLRNNHTEAQLTGFKSQLETLNANLKAVGDTRKGDVLLFDFTPDGGTRLSVNGQLRGTPIPGEDFYEAVLRIWLGDKPADGDLKKRLLGGA